MKDQYALFAEFKSQFPEIHEKNEALGEYIHQHGGPLDEKTRWLVKVGISAASHHQNAVSTHVAKAREAGASEEEILHALFLVIPTCGFPTFMEAYRIYKDKD
ncbi:MAG: carboxymuconolactone decarboxylase family protein [Actinobacteria bacterium]|nr:carboxymuconolactone decarboxylase family protein [Actinomycetota bacterium]